MEINIRLAGVQLGPYSEKQIREYLAEGLVSSADLACEEGSQEWIPVMDLLAKAPPAESDSSVSAPPAMADAVFEDPEPMDEPIRAPSPPEPRPDLPIRAPEPDKDPEPVEALAKRTLMIGPTPPSRRPGKGPSASSAVTTSPLANKSHTKNVTRSSIVRGLGAKKTAPLPSRETIPIGVPQAPPSTPTMLPSSPDGPMPAAAPPIPGGTTMPPRKSGLPAILQALNAKTAPMRSTPPVPPRSGLPITTPLPTRPISLPVRAASVAPPLPDAGAPNDSASGAGETPTEKMILPAPGSAKTEQPFDALKSKALARFSARKKTDAPQPEDAATDQAPAQRRAHRRKIPFLLLGCLCLALLFGYYVWSPYHAAATVHEALTNGTPTTLDAAVNFEAVRTSLKDQFKDQILTTSHDGRAADALSMLDKSVDLYVTPTGVAGLATNSAQFPKDELAKTISPDAAANLLRTFNTQPVRSSGLASLTDFIMKTDVAIMHLQFSALKWKLTRVDLRPDLRASSAGDAASPLLSPVIDTYLNRGADLARQSDWKGAIGEFSHGLALDSHSAGAYVARGGARESSGDLNGAIQDFSQAITLNPQMAEAFNGRGNVRSAKNDLDGAIADFSQAVKIDPTLAAAYNSRGSAKTIKNDLDGAIADFSQAITIEPTMASAFGNRGYARQANGNLDGAISDYTQAISLDPKAAAAFYNRGLARQSHGDLDAAILDFGHAIALNPKNAGAYYNRATAKNALKDLDGSIADFTQTLSINPKDAMAYTNRGLVRQAKNDLDGALADYTQALDLDPKIAPAYYNRGLIRGQSNDPDGAIADASHSLDIDPKNNQAYYNRAYAKLLKGNLDGAESDFRQFCNLAPHISYADNARLYLWLIAKAESAKLDADQALSDALENNWNSTADDLATKTASYLLGRSSEAEYIAGAISNDPKIDQGLHCEVYYFAGMHRLLIGDKPAAIDFFRKSVATGQKDFCEYSLAQAELLGLAPPAPLAPLPVPVPVKTPSP